MATEAEELPRLDQLAERGRANGVPGLEMIGPERLRELEPHAVGIKALYSPATGIVDYSRVARAYAQEVTAHGGEIRTNHAVTAITRREGFSRIETSAGDVTARWDHQLRGAGSGSCCPHSPGAPRTPQIVPFRGDYYVLRPERRDWVTGMIYPVPDPRFPVSRRPLHAADGWRRLARPECGARLCA